MWEPTTAKTGRTWILLFLAVLIGAALDVLYLKYPSFVAALNYKTTDYMLRMAPKKPLSGAVVIVDIDERSLAQFGQWPWPRSLLAQLLDSIAASGPATVGVDLILAEPSRTTGQDEMPNPDLVLEKTLSKGPFVLGYVFLFRQGPKRDQKSTLHPPGIVLANVPDTGVDHLPFFTARGVVYNLPSFSNAVKFSGFLNATPDSDGVLRRLPTLIRFQDSLYPSFPLAMLMRYENERQIGIAWREMSGRFDLYLGDRPIPVDKNGNLRIIFRPVAVTPRVSAGAVLTGNYTHEQFRKKIILVGSSAAGLESVYVTAGGALYTPADVHAQVLENLLTGQNVVRTDNFLLWEAIMGIGFALVTALAVAAMSILPSAGVCAGLIGADWIGSELAFQGSGYLFSPLLPTILVLVNYPVLTIVKTWQALVDKQLQLERINVGLEQRVNEAVADLRAKDQLLIQQGRQAAMGEMISNIAHQWRQPLNMLGLIVQELRLTYGTAQFKRETLDASVGKAMSLIQHMSQTIDDFRSYFKPDKEKTVFTATHAVERTLSLVGPSLAAMEIHVEIKGSGDTEIYGYPNEYSQVLLNILLNCRDAFEGSSVAKRIITVEIGKEGGKSLVLITDNAGGIPEDIIGKIFDPYFTTKSPEKGTGIGLYMAKTIVEKNMGGRITVRNTGEGAQFAIEV